MATSEKLEEALSYAAHLHREQTRKISGVPYVVHLLGVATIVGENGGDEEQIIAGLLHDGPEDQGGEQTLNEIRERFGDRVADIVEACSDTMVMPKPPWKERKEKYIEHVKHASADARLVSASDKLYNARTILEDLESRGPSIWDSFKGGRDGTIWYFQSLADEFIAGGPASIGNKLAEIVGRIESH